ncbi:MAG: TonB-dependent receptor [Bacteroidales bacterium]|nr:TonB-dependent receptor [Bacteroidales bacterium]
MLKQLFSKVLAASMILISATAFAQSVKITGTVVDEAGLPVVGAAVIQVGAATNGAATDLDGAYSLSVPKGASVEVSSIGYVSQTFTIGDQTVYRTVLKEDTQLIEETVVIGYGVQKKSDLTGSVASVSEENLQNRSTTDAAAALQGKAAGIMIINSSGAPGASASIRVRGFSSNSGNIGPLLIVDGLKVSSIDYLDPSMIQSMEVLKDAASAAIYGAQAGNGVVLITTKNGAANNGNSSITYDFKYTAQRLGKKAEIFRAQDWIAYKKASGIDMDGYLQQNNYDGTDTDWFDVVFEPSFSQQHAITFQGGNNKGHFFTSINYSNNDGIVVGDRDTYTRLSAQLNADYQLYKWFTVGTNTSIERRESKSVSQQGRYGSLMGSVLTLDPLTPVYYSDPSQFAPGMQEAYQKGKNIMKDPKTGLWYATSKYVDDDNGNPFIQRDKTDSSNESINLRGTLYANITPFKGLTYTSRFGYRAGLSNSHSYSAPYYATKLAYTDNYSISAGANTNWYYQWENFANYNFNIKKHAITAMAGMSYTRSHSDNVSASASGPDILLGYEENFRYLNYVNSLDTTTKTFSNAPSESASIAYFGRLTYAYDNRYSFQANFRADAFDSSKLSKKARWGYFPSFSAGWTVSNEKFFKENVSRDAVSFLKLRASWGQNGNINVLSGYQYDATIGFNSKMYQFDVVNPTFTYGSAPNGLANPSLKWETSEQLDLGLDARFLNNRLSVAFDYFDKRTKDLLVNIAPIPEIGVNNTYVNAGSVLNTGLELELGWKDTIGDLSYSINGNISKLHNEVTYLDPSIYRLENSTYSYNNKMTTSFEVGYPIWFFRGYKFNGVNPENGQAIYEDVNDDGIISDADRTFIGKGIPDYTYGITINLDYKGFDFTLYGTGTIGNNIMNMFYQADSNMRNSLRYFYDNAWTESNKNAPVPSCISVANDWTYWSSSGVVFDGSYFKIKQIQLGYTLPTKLTKKALINKSRVFVSVDDWFTFTKYPGFDPETATTGNSTNMGMDNGSYPTARKIVGGITITF